MRILLFITFAILTSCVSKSPRPTDILLVSESPKPDVVYVGDIPFEDFQNAFRDREGINCVYHTIDYDIGSDGSVEKVVLADSSYPTFSDVSLKAVKRWRFKDKDLFGKKGRAAIVYRSNKEPLVLAADRNLQLRRETRAKGEYASVGSPIKRTIPRYPKSAAYGGVGGFVELEFMVREDGSVTDVEVVKSFPHRTFDRNAKKAVKNWRYKPQKEPTLQTVILDFMIGDPDTCFFYGSPKK